MSVYAHLVCLSWVSEVINHISDVEVQTNAQNYTLNLTSERRLTLKGCITYWWGKSNFYTVYFYLESQRTYIFTDRSSREPFVNTNIDGKLQLDLLKEVVMLSLRNYFFFPVGKIDSFPKKLYKRKFILAAQRSSYSLVCIILEVFLLSWNRKKRPHLRQKEQYLTIDHIHVIQDFHCFWKTWNT